MKVEIIEGSAPSNSVNTHDDDNVIYIEYERSKVYDELCKYLLSSRDKHCFMGSRSDTLYWQTIISFDIETTNTYIDKNKVSFMYIWQVAFQDIVIVGRTWDQFLDLCDLFKYTFGLDEEHRMIIWVHNLAHEFQFIRKLFKWEQVFASEERKVIYFASSGCGYCELQTPILGTIAEDYDMEYFEIDSATLGAKQRKEITEKLEIEGATPTTVIVQNGKVIDTAVGYTDGKDYVEFFEDNKMVPEDAVYSKEDCERIMNERFQYFFENLSEKSIQIVENNVTIEFNDNMCISKGDIVVLKEIE